MIRRTYAGRARGKTLTEAYDWSWTHTKYIKHNMISELTTEGF